MDFSEWLLGKYKEWSADRIGRSASITAYANLFDAPPQLVGKWMTPPEKGGKVPRSAKYINALVSVYGDEVYTVLDMERTDQPETLEARAQRILDLLEATPETDHERLFELIDQFMTLKGWRRVK